MRTTSAILKSLTLIVGLIAIVAAMQWLRSGRAAPFFEALGLRGEPSGAGPVAAPSAPLELCPSRIHSFEWPDGAQLVERPDGLRGIWTRTRPQDAEVPYLQVERWLSARCRVASAPASGRAEVFVPLLTMTYVDGAKALIERSTAPHRYRFRGRTVISPELTAALDELRALAGLPAKGP